MVPRSQALAATLQVTASMFPAPGGFGDVAGNGRTGSTNLANVEQLQNQ